MTPLVPLRTFLEVHRSRSISRAAVSLGITQPAASAHIRTLEQQLGRPLFRRHARGVEATPAGDELAAAVGTDLDGLEATFSALRARAEAVVGTVRLAGPVEFLRARMADPLARLTAAGLSVRVTLGGRDVIYRALREGAVDLAVTASRPGERGLDFAKIGEERLVPVAAPAWVARTLGDRAALSGALAAPAVADDEDLSLLRSYLEAARLPADVLKAAAVAPNLRMVRDLVEAGCGWSVLPDYLVEEALAARRLRRLDAGRTRVTNALYLVWPKAALRHPRVSYARERLLEAFAR